MSSEAIKVIVRCRPLNQREKNLKCKIIVSMDSCSGICSIVNPNDPTSPPKTFTFDGAYFVDSTTEQIYNEVVYPLVESVTEGYNGTVFAYGQTGCGKSFSMQGVCNPHSQRGIIPRAFEHIFEAIALAERTKYLCHASYLEIYNEEIRDLLGADFKKKLEIKEHPDKGVYVAGLSLHPVYNVKQCEDIMEKGWKNRSVGATLMNADSSRSHSIFTIYLEMMDSSEDSEEGEGHIRQGKLNLVDLAGSERQAKTGATGERLKEATKINLSLSALGNVISALVDGKSKHIPYRDSKLTRLLQDSLGGNTKTLMVACLSPADNNYDETLSTLRYANRAKNITNKPKINEDPKDALLRQYQEEIERLKTLLSKNSSPPPPAPPLSPQPATVEENKVLEDVERIRQEYSEKMQGLMTQFQHEQENNARLQEDVARLKAFYEKELSKYTKQEPATQQEQEGIGTKSDPAAPVATFLPDGRLDTPHSSPVPGTVIEQNHHSIEDMQAKALERLQQLQEQMVGGEKKHDKELKEKRAKRKTMANKRIQALAEALAKVDDDDRVMLKVYDDIQEELKAKTALLKRAKRKIQALEREVSDIQSEFEADRTDYLETIRKQDQQIKLLQQILDKVQPCLRRDCNYSNLDRIKADSSWDEDQQKWILPEMTINRTKLPPAGVQPGGRAPSVTSFTSQTQQGYFEEPSEDKFLRKLEKGEKEDIAGNYFKARRPEQLLKKVVDIHRNRPVNNTPLHSPRPAKEFVSPQPPPLVRPLNGRTSNSVPNTSYGTVHIGGPLSAEGGVRRPTRLEALPHTTDFGRRMEKKKPRTNAFNLDWPI